MTAARHLHVVGQEERDYLLDTFGPGGALARKFPGYQQRPGQIALARAIDRGLSSKTPVLAEGPCGTGKSVAYLVPAIHHALAHGLRVCVATANIALQEQLVGKDLPSLRDVMPAPFTFALLKGRNNYLCLDKFAQSEALDFDHLEREQARKIDAWARSTTIGDKSELPFEPTSNVWGRYSCGGDECKRKECEFLKQCHSENARATATGVNVVVTNYHLLFAHLGVLENTGQNLVLPPIDILICDEAHEAADIAREFFGYSVSPYAIKRIVNRAYDMGASTLAGKLKTASEEFFKRVEAYCDSPLYSTRLRSPGWTDGAALSACLQDVERAAARIVGDEDEDRPTVRQGARTALRLAPNARRHVEESISLEHAGSVYWIEKNKRGAVSLKCHLIDVSETLAQVMFAQIPRVVLTSATMTTEGTFGFVKRELGVPDGAIEVMGESPFDFNAQARFVIPEPMPDPDKPEYADALGNTVQGVIDACGGRTLALFSSYKNLDAVHSRISGHSQRVRVMRQGERSKNELTRIFKEDETSVLLATNSFRTGFDVPGNALVGLVIDKMPFPNPSDPIMDAIQAINPRAFWEHSLPRAIMALKQAFGRLIRAKGDVGIVVLCDGRLLTKRYRHIVLNSLPPAPRVTSVAEARAFLATVRPDLTRLA